MVRISVLVLVTFLSGGAASALEPQEILIVANKDVAESMQIAQYYCQKRGVPDKNIFELPLGAGLTDYINRADYDKKIAEPIRKEFFVHGRLGKIKCLLTLYGVPIKVGRRGVLSGYEGRLRELNVLAEEERKKIAQYKQESLTDSAQHKQATGRLAQLQLEIDWIRGTETNASLDSELSMVLFEAYDLYRWQPNMLKNDGAGFSYRTLMVSRLDGPGSSIAKGLIDKALAAEDAGLRGTAYIDSRGITANSPNGRFDQSLRELAALTRSQTDIPVQEEQTASLFAPGSCPQAALYCGWYSLTKYVDAFDFVEGAVGYHIASLEALNLRDPNSSQWCPAMLKDGITATLGPVAEPYLHSFPDPRAFFTELYSGCCLVEAYYRTAPFNSWQLLLIGDPLYRPFKARPGRAGVQKAERVSSIP
jgi:uncharacterized protein (TIGR03790 family)